MKVDLDHLHYWMQAIRQSPDHNKTLDAFWRGQLESKAWLIEKVRPFVFKNFLTNKVSVDIHGGWIGVLSSMLFQSDMPIDTIQSVDIDADCESIANIMNTIEEQQGRFRALTCDMCDITPKSNLIINTVCEHLTQHQYDKWLLNIDARSLIVLQSNNYSIPEHVRTAETLEEFIEQSHLNVLWSGSLDLSMYRRYMIIGTKNV